MSEKKILSKYNIGLLAMVLFLIYIIWIIFSYVTKDKIYSYQVFSGSLAKVNNYTGIIIRDEEIIKSDGTGYVQYFAREGEHVGIGDLVYTIDQSGAMANLIQSASGGDNSLTNDDLADLRVQISNFSHVYDNTEFSRTYDFLYSMEGMVLKLANLNMLEQVSKANAITESVTLMKANTTGYVVYNIDGYESLSVNGISEAVFDQTMYTKDQLINTQLIDVGSTAYKLITSENWNIVIQLDEDRAMELQDEGYVKVRFLSDQRELSAKIDVVQMGLDYYGILTFNNSVMAYSTERYQDIEIITQEENGLKIPVKSIVYKEFYLVPTEYAVEDGENNNKYFLRKTFLEDGTLSAELVSLEVYAEVDDYYYIDDSALSIGDYLLKTDGSSEYPVATKGELMGVYNMNMGYADFRRINMLYENEEYAIVESNTMYGLKEYDYIVLDASAVSEDDFIYE